MRLGTRCSVWQLAPDPGPAPWSFRTTHRSPHTRHGTRDTALGGGGSHAAAWGGGRCRWAKKTHNKQLRLFIALRVHTAFTAFASPHSGLAVARARATERKADSQHIDRRQPVTIGHGDLMLLTLVIPFSLAAVLGQFDHSGHSLRAWPMCTACPVRRGPRPVALACGARDHTAVL